MPQAQAAEAGTVGVGSRPCVSLRPGTAEAVGLAGHGGHCRGYATPAGAPAGRQCGTTRVVAGPPPAGVPAERVRAYRASSLSCSRSTARRMRGCGALLRKLLAAAGGTGARRRLLPHLRGAATLVPAAGPPGIAAPAAMRARGPTGCAGPWRPRHGVRSAPRPGVQRPTTTGCGSAGRLRLAAGPGPVGGPLCDRRRATTQRPPAPLLAAADAGA